MNRSGLLPIRFMLLVIVVLLTQACVTRSPANLKPVFMVEEARYQIASSRVVIGTDPQRGADPMQANSGREGGLLGAILASAITHSQNTSIDQKEKILAPIKTATLKYNYASKFRDYIKKDLMELEWLNINKIIKKNEQQYNRLGQLLNKTTEDALLLVDTGFEISPDLSRFIVSAFVILVPKNQSLVLVAQKVPQETVYPVLYRHYFTYEHEVEGGYVNQMHAMEMWSRDHGSMVTKALDESIPKLAEMIVRDIQSITISQALNQPGVRPPISRF